MRWLFVALFTTAAAMAAGQNGALPEGDGKAIVSGACGSCHGLDLITGKTATRDEWAAVVDRMKTYGATLDDKQTTTVVDYLAKSFPPKGAAPAPATAPAPAPAGGQDDTDAAGKAMVNGVCSSCHGADLITGKQATRKEWQDILDRMKGYGANLDQKQTTTLLDYLEKNQGPKQQAAAGGTDAGKALLEANCTGCHDLDLIMNRTGTEAEWKEVVDRMNGRGAGVPDKDVPALVQYLAKTYRPK
jgi:cytochrome c5